MSNSVPSLEQRDAMGGGAANLQPLIDQATQAAQTEEQAEFARRLQALKSEGLEKKQQQQQKVGRPQAGATLSSTASTAAFDTSPEDIYASPPSLSQTLLSQLNADVSDPKLKDAAVGPSQLAIAGGAVVFGLIFVLASGIDFAGPSNRFKGVRSAIEPPDSVEEGIIKTRISSLEEQLRVTPGDPEATQALALSYAQLLQYDKAANLLDKLAAAQPNNADAWRLLGETSLLGQQANRAVKAYERAVGLRGDDLQIATGMTDAYIAAGQQAKAVAYLQGLRSRAPSTSALGVTAVEARGSGTAESITTDDAIAPSSADAGPPPEADTAAAQPPPQQLQAQQPPASRSRPIRPLEPVGVELLLAKTYSGWRGHDADAIATYDAVIARFPEDFRAYLAKGVFLRDKGRRADAERMFLQAKFWAPDNRQQLIREAVKDRPVVDLPDQ